METTLPPAAEVLAAVKSRGYATPEMLRRKFNISYTAAREVIAGLMEKGVLGPREGMVPHQYLGHGKKVADAAGK